MTLRIVLVAPVAPFRGGIARHSQALANALARLPQCSIEVVSFRRLFPKLLYPGTTDRDPASSLPPGLPVRYSVDTLNPLSWLKAARDIARQGPDLVVMPAWTFFVAPALGTLARSLRKRGVRVAMIVHNVTDHEGARWKTALSQWQLDQADAYLTHGEALAESLRAIAGSRQIAVAPHPPYSDYPPARGTLAREHALELLCFGLVRPYKGVDVAIEALGAVRDRDVRLTIAGEIWQNAAELRDLAQRCGVAQKVEFIDRYVSDQEAAELFQRADAALAPYRAVTGSGVVALARHYGRPTIASDLPGFAEVICDTVDGWLFPAGNTKALAEIIRSLTREAAAKAGEAIPRDPDAREWDAFAATLAALARPIA